MHHFDDPKEMTIEERFKEVSAILAAGYMRLKKRTPYLPELTAEDRQNPDIHVPQDTQAEKESSAVYRETTWLFGQPEPELEGRLTQRELSNKGCLDETQYR